MIFVYRLRYHIIFIICSLNVVCGSFLPKVNRKCGEEQGLSPKLYSGCTDTLRIAHSREELTQVRAAFGKGFLPPDLGWGLGKPKEGHVCPPLGFLLQRIWFEALRFFSGICWSW